MPVRKASYWFILLLTLWFPFSGIGQRQLYVATGQGSAINKITFSPDEKYFLTSGIQNTFKLWETATAKEIRTFRGHTSYVFYLGFSPTDQYIYSAGPDNSIKIWNYETGRLFNTIRVNELRDIKVHPNKNQLIVLEENKIRIRTIPSGKTEQEVSLDTIRGRAVLISPDGKNIICIDEQEKIHVYKLLADKIKKAPFSYRAFSNNISKNKLKNGQPLKQEIKRKRIQYLTFDLNPKHIYVKREGLMPVKYHLRSGKVLAWDAFELHPRDSQMTLVSRGAMLVTASPSDSASDIRVYNMQTGKLNIFFESKKEVDKLEISPRSGLLAMRLVSSGVLIYDLKGSKSRYQFLKYFNYAKAVKFSVDGKKVLAGFLDGSVKQLHLDQPIPVTRLRKHHLQKGITDIALSAKHAFCIGAVTGHVIHVWDKNSGNEHFNLKGHRGAISGIDLSPDERQLLSSGWDSSVRLWDLQDQEEIKQIKFPGAVLDARFSPDGKQIAIVGRYTGIQIHTLAEENTKWKISNNEWMSAVCWAPDGNQIASGNELNGSIKIWDWEREGILIRILRGHTSGVSDLIYSSDGKTLFSGGKDGKIIIWDLQTGMKQKEWYAHSSRIYALAISPDERLLVSTSGDRAIKLWDLESGTEIATIHSVGILGGYVVLTPDGKYDVNAEGEKELYYVEKLKTYPIQPENDPNYEPDLLRRRINEYYRKSQINPTAVSQAEKNCTLIKNTTGPFRALYFVNEEYQQKEQFSKLKGLYDQVQSFKKVLEQDFGFTSNPILHNPSARDILSSLTNLEASLKPNDNLLIVYSGHGKPGYWCPTDAVMEQDKPIDNFISYRELEARLADLKCRHILVICHGCDCGTMIDKTQGGEDLMLQNELYCRRGLTSTYGSGAQWQGDQFFERLTLALQLQQSPCIRMQKVFNTLWDISTGAEYKSRYPQANEPNYGHLYQAYPRDYDGDKGDFLFIRSRD